MRDRTADLFAASEALSQLSYSPTTITTSDLVLVESEAHSKQSPVKCQPLILIIYQILQN
jgi:hypothetical protein